MNRFDIPLWAVDPKSDSPRTGSGHLDDPQGFAGGACYARLLP